MAAAVLSEHIRSSVAACVERRDAAELEACEAAFNSDVQRLGDALRAADERRSLPEGEGASALSASNAALAAQLQAQESLLVAHRERLERWRAECADCSAAALRSVPGTGTLHSKPGTEAAAAAAAAAARADSSHDGMEEDDEVWE